MNIFHEFFGDPLEQARKAKGEQPPARGDRAPASAYFVMFLGWLFSACLWLGVALLIRSAGLADLPWAFFIVSFSLGLLTGFATSSHGSFYQSAAGQIVQGLLSIGCFAMIAVAFWYHGWKIGALDILVVFTGANVGYSLFLFLWRR